MKANLKIAAPDIEVPHAAALRRALLGWYRRNRRDLPWRRTRDPYRIWVSEIMLQQTQVATVLPFYQSFLDHFPTIAHLARADQSDVLRAWSGLGYYRRARQLHDAARRVMSDHGGEIPQLPEAFESLPGIGRYTCGAVLSIAFGRPLPVLDGNVARVLARLFAQPVSVREPPGARALWALAERLVPMRGAGDWNQALMELGATCCTMRPGCAACPVRSFCRAFATNSVDRYPTAVTRPATRRVRRAVAIVQRGGKWLLVRRSGRWLDGLWEPPGVTLGARTTEGAIGVALGAELARLGVPIAELSATGHRVRHRITQHAIVVDVWEGTTRVGARLASECRWVDVQNPDVALTGLTLKLARVEGAVSAARAKRPRGAALTRRTAAVPTRVRRGA